MGLDRGLSPVYDLLVDRYFTIPDGLEGSLNRLKENKIARYMMYTLMHHNEVYIYILYHHE